MLSRAKSLKTSVALDGIDRFSQVTQLALRAAFVARLMQRGLKIEQDDE